mmetsp:Transcript_66783/g.168620  ORF Transcript_66783/g.168620 Transcript_66783/m.168620 type:complete len:400 (-) Transcript_66783:83-1282(-)
MAGAEACVPGTIGGTQGWILIDANKEDVILKEGFKVERRDYVPISRFEPTVGAKALARWEKNEIAVALEVHGVAEEDIKKEEKDGRVRTYIAVKFLPPANLRTGLVFERSEITNKCPFCGKLHEEGSQYAEWHRMLGKRFFANQTELVAPGCCHGKQAERQERLSNGRTVILYHQTNEWTLGQIEESGKMLRGSEGTVGGAIYFALTPRETQWKTLRRGVMLVCEVQLGNMLKVDVAGVKKPPYKKLTFAHMMNPDSRGENPDLDLAALKLDPVPGDSILLNRGTDWREDRVQFGMPSAPEVVIFSWQQVKLKHAYKASPGDAWAQELGWFPDEIKAAHEKYKAGQMDRAAYENEFLKHTPELKPYQGLDAEAHMQKAEELLQKNFEAWKEARAEVGAA